VVPENSTACYRGDINMDMSNENQLIRVGTQTTQRDRLSDLLLVKVYDKVSIQRQDKGDINIEPFYQVSLQAAFDSEGVVTDIR
jgi:hypothetical protein